MSPEETTEILRQFYGDRARYRSEREQANKLIGPKTRKQLPLELEVGIGAGRVRG